MISIVTPVYNEEDNIVFFYDAKLFHEFFQAFGILSMFFRHGHTLDIQWFATAKTFALGVFTSVYPFELAIDHDRAK